MPWRSITKTERFATPWWPRQTSYCTPYAGDTVRFQSDSRGKPTPRCRANACCAKTLETATAITCPPAACTCVSLSRRSEEHRLNSSHITISYAVFCLKKKKKIKNHFIHKKKKQKNKKINKKKKKI